MRQSLDFKGPPSKTAYTVLDLLSGRFGVKPFFFFFGEHLDFGRKIGKLEVKLKWRPFFFFREHLDFGRKIGKSEVKLKWRPFFFFLENTLILGEKYPSPDQTSFFSQTTWIFENSCLGPLNWNIHHCTSVFNVTVLICCRCLFRVQEMILSENLFFFFF